MQYMRNAENPMGTNFVQLKNETSAEANFLALANAAIIMKM